MGIDYVAFANLASLASEDDLRGLIINQSRTFRAMPYYYWPYPSSYQRDEVLSRLQNYLFLDTCRATSVALRSKIALIPEESRRVAYITNSPIMPPLLRFQAYSSFLPSHLKAQLDGWQRWWGEVRKGQHDNYLKELYLEFISWELVRVYDEALSLAKYCLERPRSVDAARAICLYPRTPYLIPIAVKPIPQDEAKQQDMLKEIGQHQQKLLPLIKDLNYTVRKHRVELGHSWWGFDKFRAHFVEEDQGNLQEFLNWVSGCCVNNYGLYLSW